MTAITLRKASDKVLTERKPHLKFCDISAMSDFTDADESGILGLISLVTERGGVVSDSIKFVHNEESGTGIFATAALAAREVLVSVPFSQCISAESVSTTCLSEILSTRPGLMNYPDEVIAMGLMYAATHERREDCPWIEHIKTIPKSYNTPLYWSDGELSEIKGYNVCHLTNLMKKQIRADWDGLHEPLTIEYPDLLGGATIELYQWALSTVYSRAVGIHRNGQYTRCIPPVVDMANHNPEAGSEAAETLSYDEENDTVSFINTTPKVAGEECSAVYGNYCNGKLLYTYGFVILHSPHKAVDLWTRVTANIAHVNEKQSILNAHELTREPTYDFVGTLRPGFISPALLATIRIVQADQSELECAEAAFRGEMLSVRNEKASYVSLRNLLLNGMKVETAMADKERLGEMLLTNVSKSNRLLMALILRVEEREFLQEMLVLVDKLIGQLEDLGESYIPPDSPFQIPETTTA